MSIGLASFGSPLSRTNIGNQNVAVTSIGGAIAASRTSGKTPCFIHVSASGVTASGTSPRSIGLLPYEDLEYRWDFGDPSGTEIFTRPTDGALTNANFQSGPEGFYCYRSAGTYTITLRVRGKSAAGYVSATIQQAITVTAHPTTDVVYFDSNAPGGGDGTSAATAYNTIANLSDFAGGGFWTHHKTDCVIRLAYGSSWSGSAGIRIANGAALGSAMSGLRIEAYAGSYSSSKSLPVIDVSSGTTSSGTQIPMHFGSTNSNLAWSKTDFVVSNVRFTISGTTVFNTCLIMQPGDSAAAMSYFYFDNVQCASLRTASATQGNADVCQFLLGANGSTTMDGIGFWGGSVTAPLTQAPARMNLIGGGAARNWWAVVGIQMSGAGNSNGLDHFIYPDCQNNGLYKWITFGDTGGFLNYAINGNWNSASGNFEYVQYQCVSECAFGTGSGTTVNHLMDAAQSQTAVATFTNGSANIVLTGSQSPFPSVNGQIAFQTTNTLPVGLSPNTLYYITSVASTTIQVSATQGGAAITAGSAGSGTHQAITCAWKNFVFERCAANSMPLQGFVFEQAWTFTCRGNRSWNPGIGTFFWPSAYLGNALSFAFYGNDLAVPATAGAGNVIDISFNSNFPGDTWSTGNQITGNIVADQRATAQLISVDFTKFPSNGSTVDTNQYWAPNDSNSSPFYNNTTQANLSAWQAQLLDVNGTNANPGWPTTITGWSDFSA